MGSIRKTPAGRWQASWRDPAGRKRARNFATRKEANAFLSEIDTALNRGTYIDPRAGKIKLGDYARRWFAARVLERTTAARDASVMRTHVLPRWGDTPLVRIDHTSVQQWVTDLSRRLAPATVVECHRILSGVMRSAVRDRLIAFNPCEGVQLPKRRRKDIDGQIITQEDLVVRLLPAVPERYRALVGLAGGTGLRWGECIGVRWDALDLVGHEVDVIRVAVEVAGHVTAKPYPKSRAGRRKVPLPAFVLELLADHAQLVPPGPAGEVFTNADGGPMRRTNFRARVWRPALVRAGLLGNVEKEEGPDPDEAPRFRGSWVNDEGTEQSALFNTEEETVQHVARRAGRSLRFHDLRHSYATHLITSGVPINDAQAVMGHEQASTLLDRYTHASHTRNQRILQAFTIE
jgi:integrase